MNASEFRGIYAFASSGLPASLRFTAEGTEYVRNFRPPERLILLGCGHISQALCSYAAELGFAVTAADERPEFACAERFPGAKTIICDDFPAAIKKARITQYDYVCVLTRGHKFDADCLRELLSGEFPRYLGMIGSKRRVAMLLKQLESEGFDPAALERIHAPIGVPINALTVKEIAISIVAELIACRRENTNRRSKETQLVTEDIDLKLLDFLSSEPAPKALLAVCETSGSTPVKSGAIMAVTKDGRSVGTIGGGCSENAVTLTAQLLAGTGGEKCVTVDMSNELAAEEGMVCGGKMKVYIADVSPE